MPNLARGKHKYMDDIIAWHNLDKNTDTIWQSGDGVRWRTMTPHVLSWWQWKLGVQRFPGPSPCLSYSCHERIQESTEGYFINTELACRKARGGQPGVATGINWISLWRWTSNHKFNIEGQLWLRLVEGSGPWHSEVSACTAPEVIETTTCITDSL